MRIIKPSLSQGRDRGQEVRRVGLQPIGHGFESWWKQLFHRTCRPKIFLCQCAQIKLALTWHMPPKATRILKKYTYNFFFFSIIFQVRHSPNRHCCCDFYIHLWSEKSQNIILADLSTRCKIQPTREVKMKPKVIFKFIKTTRKEMMRKKLVKRIISRRNLEV